MMRWRMGGVGRLPTIETAQFIGVRHRTTACGARLKPDIGSHRNLVGRTR
jgi:hypothetical protein